MLAIGCSYIIHVINQVGIVKEQRGGQTDALSQIDEALKFIALPVIVSAMTIIAGFLSVAFNKIPAIRTTGIYSAVGASITCLLSLTFIPAMLAISSKRKLAFRVGLQGRLVKLLENMGKWATSHQMLLYMVTAGIVLVSLIGMRRIVIDVDFFHFFKPNSETSIGLAEINQRLSGGITFEVIIEGKKPDAIVSPDILRRIEALQAFAEKLQGANGQRVD